MNFVKTFQSYLSKIKREKYLSKEINKSLTMNKREFNIGSQYGVVNDIFIRNRLDFTQDFYQSRQNCKKCTCCGNVFVGQMCPICSRRE